MGKPEERLFYAVQENNEDDRWDYGSYDYAEAVEMAKAYPEGKIIVIDHPETNPFCLDEVEHDDLDDYIGADDENLRWIFGADGATKPKELWWP